MSEVSEQPVQKKGISTAIIVVVLIAILAVAGFVYASNGNSQDAAREEQAATPQNAVNKEQARTEETTETATASSYTNGTYEATGEYQSPGGQESIDVTLTLENGVITDADVISKAERPISQKMQGQFIDGYKDEVIGQNIDDVQLDVVSGSSLTPDGFNDAVEKIKQQAQA